MSYLWGTLKTRPPWSNFTTLPADEKNEIIMLYLNTVLDTFQSRLVPLTPVPGIHRRTHTGFYVQGTNEKMLV